MERRYRFALVVAVSLAGCGVTAGSDTLDPADSPTEGDGGQDSTCDSTSDSDGDCLADGIEGCAQVPPPDGDRDGIPDFRDPDSDGDGIGDTLEAGDCAAPRDTDGDGAPDYADPDSDGDGVGDGSEDRNGDGRVGQCTLRCATASQCPEGATCWLEPGAGVGLCIDAECLDGETNPRAPDTDGDGIPDGDETTAICNPRGEQDPTGLKPLKFADSTGGAFPESNWRLGLEQSAIEGRPTIVAPRRFDGVHTFDMAGGAQQVAGFLASRAAASATAVDELGDVVTRLQAVSALGQVTVRSSGNNTTTLDGFETVIGARLVVETRAFMTVTELRELVVPVLLGRPAAQVEFAPPSWAAPVDTSFVLGLQAIRRDEAGQTLFVGGVARTRDTDDVGRLTGFVLDDMSNGTGVTVSGNGVVVECESLAPERGGIADIIWVVDESGSVRDDRDRIAGSAAVFFDKAIAAGLDFRVAVTDMNRDGPGGQPGIFASRNSGGTGDRWLGPLERLEFEESIRDPSGPDSSEAAREHGLTQARAAIERHLPRGADPQMIREGAKLVVIFVSDEKPDELEDAGVLGEGNREPNATERTSIATLVEPYLELLRRENATAYLIAEPLPFSVFTCSEGSEHGYGYYHLVNETGGQVGSICQDDLSATMDALIDDIIGTSSDTVLSHVPISASVSVAKDSAELVRSRVFGFDYRAIANSIVFAGVRFIPNEPADIIVAYRRWVDQVVVD